MGFSCVSTRLSLAPHPARNSNSNTLSFNSMPALATQFSPCSVRCSPFHQHRYMWRPPLLGTLPLTRLPSVRYVVGCSQHFGIVGNGQVAVVSEQGGGAVIQVRAELRVALALAR